MRPVFFLSSVLLGVAVYTSTVTGYPTCADIGTNNGVLEISNDISNISAQYMACTNITSLSFESNSTLTEIGGNAFDMASNLTGEIDIPSSVTSIGDRAFQGTNINIVKIPESVVQIGMDVFNSYTDLEKVYVYGNAAWGDVNSFNNLRDSLCSPDPVALPSLPCVGGEGTRASNLINDTSTCNLTACSDNTAAPTPPPTANNTAAPTPLPTAPTPSPTTVPTTAPTGPTPAASKSDDDDDDDELSTGALVGIIVGGVAFLSAVGFFVYRRRRIVKGMVGSSTSNAGSTTYGNLIF